MGTGRELPEVNAGSMADIAFLLLIFFLITTTLEVDSGLEQLLPMWDPDPPLGQIKDRNLLEVGVNGNNELMLSGELAQISSIKEEAISFLDNGGDGQCDYCQGNEAIEKSENPKNAIIMLSTARKADYETYVLVRSELLAAYTILRNREASARYGMDYETLEILYNDIESSPGEKLKMREKIETIRTLYPLKLIEGETQP